MSEEEAGRPSLGASLRLLVTLPVVGVALWLACWHVWLGGLWWLGLALGWQLARGTLFQRGMYGVLGLFLVPWCVVRYDARSQTLMHRVEVAGPQALSTADMAAVLGLNGAMGVAGYGLGFREVALETLWLMVPGAERRVRQDATFPLCAPAVARVVSAHQARALAGESGPWRRRVAWTYDTPSDDHSFRAALALNPSQVETHREGDALRVEVTVPANYPPRSRLVFATLGPIQLAVEEGLLHALEERGWLHPYEMVWQARVGMEEELPEPCEAWVVRLIY